MRPSLRSAAPEKAPRSTPNSSLSSRSSGRLAHGMRAKGRSRRGLHSWMRRARISLPVPLSPKISTLERVGAALRASSSTSRMARDRASRPRRSAASRAGAASGPAPSGSAGDADLGRVTPKSLEVVEQPPLAGEDVQHEVAEVHQDPIPLLQPLDVVGAPARAGAQLLLDVL